MVKKCDRHEGKLAYFDAGRELCNKIGGTRRSLNGSKYRYIRKSLEGIECNIYNNLLSLATDRYDKEIMSKAEIGAIRDKVVDKVFKNLYSLKRPLYSLWRMTKAENSAMTKWIDLIDNLARICNGLYYDKSKQRKIGEHLFRAMQFKDGANVPHIAKLNKLCEITYTRMRHAKGRDESQHNVNMLDLVDTAWSEVMSANSIHSFSESGLESRQVHYTTALNALNQMQVKIYRFSELMNLSDRLQTEWAAALYAAKGSIEATKAEENVKLRKMRKERQKEEKEVGEEK